MRDVVRDRVPQARIYRYWAMPGRTTQESLLLGLAADVLGRQVPRLYEALVVQQKIATEVSAEVEEHELASQFQLTVTLAQGTDVTEGARRLDSEIARFLQSGPSDDELERVRMGRYSAFVRGIERVGGFTGKTAVLAEGSLYVDDPAFYRTQLQWMREAAAADVTGSAREWLGRGYHQVDVLPFGNLVASGGPAPTAARFRSSHRHRSSLSRRSRRDGCRTALG